MAEPSRTKKLLALLGFAATACLIGWVVMHLPHLLWYFSGPYKFCSDVRAVPVSKMPVAEAPKDYVLFEVGSVRLQIPAALAVNPKLSVDGRPSVTFEAKKDSITLLLPCDNRQVAAAWQREIGVPGEAFSEAKVRAQCFATSALDFRWSMTKEELYRHEWFVTRSKLIREDASTVETILGGEVEGLLQLTSHGSVFNWYSADGSAFGILLFSKGMKLETVRAICQSVKCSGEVYPLSMTEAELAKLLPARR